ncbi:MAG: hypothetical protein HW416_1934 [Chloroflexi bacterium]|nr:hypothetical protein [Chloroflexota bacterium]
MSEYPAGAAFSSSRSSSTTSSMGAKSRGHPRARAKGQAEASHGTIGEEWEEITDGGEDNRAMAAVEGHEAGLDRQYDELYARYGRPLESAHRGQYLAVSQDGRTVIGATLLEVTERAEVELGTGNFIYKVGGPAVGKWR